MALTPDDIASREFKRARKGYDTDEVRRFLLEVASHGADRTNSGYVGERVGAVLESAERAATEIVSAAREEADLLKRDAESFAADQRALATRVITDAENAATSMRRDAERYAADTRAASERHAEALRCELEGEQRQHEQRRVEQLREIERLRADADAHADLVEKKVAERLERARADAEAMLRRIERDARAITAEAQQSSALQLDEARERADLLVSDGQRQVTELMLIAERDAAARAETVLRTAQHRLEIMVAAEREVVERMSRAFEELRAAPEIDQLAAPRVLPSASQAPSERTETPARRAGVRRPG